MRKGCEEEMIDEKVLLQSRPEALNDKMDMELQNQKCGYNNGWNDCLFYFIDIIKRQPKVGEWIPFTFDEEGVLNCELPDIDEDILVWDMDGTFDKENVWVDTWESPDVGVYELESGMDLEGLAWMSLHKPSKEKLEHENNR